MIRLLNRREELPWSLLRGWEHQNLGPRLTEPGQVLRQEKDVAQRQTTWRDLLGPEEGSRGRKMEVERMVDGRKRRIGEEILEAPGRKSRLRRVLP